MFVFQRNTENLDSFGNLFAFTSEWLVVDVFQLHSAEGPGGGNVFPHVLLCLLSFLFQAYTIQGQYAIPHPDVSFYSVFSVVP